MPRLSLVEWRWARNKGYYNAVERKWNDEKGGLKAYLEEIRKRQNEKKKKRGREWRKDLSSKRTKKFEDAMAAAMIRTLRRNGDKGPVEVFTSDESSGFVQPADVRMNVQGLEEMDLFCNGCGRWDAEDGLKMLQESESFASSMSFELYIAHALKSNVSNC